VFVADYFVLGRRSHTEAELFGAASPTGLRWRAFAAWILGFAVYQWCVPTGPAAWRDGVQTVLHSWLHLPFPLAASSAGASLPSFAAAIALYLVLSWRLSPGRR